MSLLISNTEFDATEKDTSIDDKYPSAEEDEELTLQDIASYDNCPSAEEDEKLTLREMEYERFPCPGCGATWTADAASWCDCFDYPYCDRCPGIPECWCGDDEGVPLTPGQLQEKEKVRQEEEKVRQADDAANREILRELFSGYLRLE